jgi:hypothetical protein
VKSLSKQRCLVLDTSSPKTFVGICNAGTWLSLHSSEKPALESLFSLLDDTFNSASLKPSAIDALLYCAGPGSTLGVRLTCMTLRTWKRIGPFNNTPTYAYLSLPLMAAILEATVTPHHPFHVITELRKDAWNLLTVPSTGTLPPLEETSTLPESEGTYFYFPQRRKNTALPQSTTLIDYSIEALPCVINHPTLFTPTEMPSPYDSKEPTYAIWSAERHR